MRNRMLIPFVLLAATGTLAVAGCGGDDETTSTDTSGATGTAGVALTETEFVEQGNAICEAGDKEITQAGDELFGGGQPSDAQLEQFATDILLPGVQSQIDGIRALPAPEEIADDVSTFLDDAESALDEVEADPSLLAASDNEGPFADVNAQAEDLGLTSCAG